MTCPVGALKLATILHDIMIVTVPQCLLGRVWGCVGVGVGLLIHYVRVMGRLRGIDPLFQGTGENIDFRPPFFKVPEKNIDFRPPPPPPF